MRRRLGLARGSRAAAGGDGAGPLHHPNHTSGLPSPHRAAAVTVASAGMHAAAPPASEGQHRQATSRGGRQHRMAPISQPCTTMEARWGSGLNPNVEAAAGAKPPPPPPPPLRSMLQRSTLHAILNRTLQCQEAAVAAMRAQHTGAGGGWSLSPTGLAPGGTPTGGSPGQSAFNTALAQRGQSFSPDSSGMASPPDTPASALKSPTAAAATLLAGGSGSNATPKAVRGRRQGLMAEEVLHDCSSCFTAVCRAPTQGEQQAWLSVLSSAPLRPSPAPSLLPFDHSRCGLTTRRTTCTWGWTRAPPPR